VGSRVAEEVEVRGPDLYDADASQRELDNAVLVIVNGRVLKHRYGHESGTTLVTHDGQVIWRPESK
jgi:hypothetical protein